MASVLTPRPGILEISPYVGGRSRIEGRDKAIKLSSNESALGPSPRALEAYRALDGLLYRYPDGGSSALTEDFYKAFLRKDASQVELVWVGRGMVLLIAVVAILLAANPENRVLGLVSYAWAGFGAAFGPVVILSLVWKQMTRNGALAGMLVGALTVILWKNFLGHLGLYEIIPGFILATLAIVVFSKVGNGPSASMIKRFDDAEKEYQSA